MGDGSRLLSTLCSLFVFNLPVHVSASRYIPSLVKLGHRRCSTVDRLSRKPRGCVCKIPGCLSRFVPRSESYSRSSVWENVQGGPRVSNEKAIGTVKETNPIICEPKLSIFHQNSKSCAN